MLGSYPGLSPFDGCRLLNLRLENDSYLAVSLLQNAERVRWRQAAVVAAGVGAVGCHELGMEWAYALTKTPEEAEALHAKMNGERLYELARAEARSHGAG